jgi:hypothetical protein
VFIDNAKLRGFIDYFFDGKCNGRDCKPGCRHCSTYADRAVMIRNEFRLKWKEKKDREIDGMLAP